MVVVEVWRIGIHLSMYAENAIQFSNFLLTLNYKNMKDFKYRLDEAALFDECTYQKFNDNPGIMIESMLYYMDCIHSSHKGFRENLIFCPKIIKRSQITGKIIIFS